MPVMGGPVVWGSRERYHRGQGKRGFRAGWHWYSDKAGNGETAHRCPFVLPSSPQLPPVDSRVRGNDVDGGLEHANTAEFPSATASSDPLAMVGFCGNDGEWADLALRHSLG